MQVVAAEIDLEKGTAELRLLEPLAIGTEVDLSELLPALSEVRGLRAICVEVEDKPMVPQLERGPGGIRIVAVPLPGSDPYWWHAFIIPSLRPSPLATSGRSDSARWPS